MHLDLRQKFTEDRLNKMELVKDLKTKNTDYMIIRNMIGKMPYSINVLRSKCYKHNIKDAESKIKFLIDCGQLWVSALGRNIRNQTTEKHNIKKVDTLVGNEKLHGDRLTYYKYLTRLLIAGKKRPIVIVDWSPVSGDCEPVGSVR